MTSRRPIRIPDPVVQMHLMANGEAGRAWLEGLPDIVEELLDKWELTIGPAFEGGVVGFVAPVERSTERGPS